MGRCETCQKQISDDYKFCASCNLEYKAGLSKTQIVTQLKNINQNLGHLVALLAKKNPELEEELQKEWEKNKEEKEEVNEEIDKLNEEQTGE